MDPVLLSRIQFGITIGFHYLFPVTTLGLTAFILLFGSLHLLRKDGRCRDISSFLTRLLAPVFVMGVATGLLMPFSFGTNWGQFSRITGEVFGPLLAIESVAAFFLESVFLGILLFGRERVGRGLYWLSTFFVFLGSHLSAFFIVAANSWMQTPAGYRIEGGRLALDSLGQVIFNPSTVVRFVHTVTAAWITGAVIVCAIGAWHLVRKREEEIARTMLRVAMPFFVVLPLAEVVVGHYHILNLSIHQPAKAAAVDGTFVSTSYAPLYVFGIPDAANKRIHLGVRIPWLLSILEGWRPDTRVGGLEGVAPNLLPPVNTVFTTFRIMELMGFLLVGAGLLGGFLSWRGRLYDSTWYLRFLPLLVPAPYIANEFGWMSAEIGRQPWIVYGLLKTGDAASVVVSAAQVWASMIVLVIVYALLSIAAAAALSRIMAVGPRTVE